MTEAPTPEDFEAYSRVTRWLREAKHRAELAEGRYSINYSNEAVTVSTTHGEEPLTDEVFERLGWTRTETGWTHG